MMKKGDEPNVYDRIESLFDTYRQRLWPAFSKTLAELLDMGASEEIQDQTEQVDIAWRTKNRPALTEAIFTLMEIVAKETGETAPDRPASTWRPVRDDKPVDKGEIHYRYYIYSVPFDVSSVSDHLISENLKQDGWVRKAAVQLSKSDGHLLLNLQMQNRNLSGNQLVIDQKQTRICTVTGAFSSK